MHRSDQSALEEQQDGGTEDLRLSDLDDWPTGVDHLYCDEPIRWVLLTTDDVPHDVLTTDNGDLLTYPRYRCEGTLVACQYAGAGCTFRGPVKKVREHQAECQYKKEGE